MSAPVTQRGKASFEGIVGAFDVIVYPLQQTARMTANFEEEIIKDVHGGDTAANARNFHYINAIGLKLIDQTSPSSRAHAVAGAVFLAPYAKVTLSTFEAAAFNGDWQNMSGQEIDLGATKTGDMSISLRRYDDATQNTLMNTVPS